MESTLVGWGGFFRSLGAMIRQTQPTSVYVVFDGAGSTVNRKNLLSEYKSQRNLQRITIGKHLIILKKNMIQKSTK